MWLWWTRGQKKERADDTEANELAMSINKGQKDRTIWNDAIYRRASLQRYRLKRQNHYVDKSVRFPQFFHFKLDRCKRERE